MEFYDLCYRLSRKPVPSGPRGNRMTLSSFRRTFCDRRGELLIMASEVVPFGSVRPLILLLLLLL